MGIALWLACAAAIFLLGRLVPAGRPTRWAAELAIAILAAFAFGELATALDFGGWNEPDWRAGLFLFFGCAAVIGTVRLIRQVRQR
jgi:hypothetical protein